MNRTPKIRQFLAALALLAATLPAQAQTLAAATAATAAPTPITLTIRDSAIGEVYEMLSRQGRVNILLGQGVDGTVSVNLYEVTLDAAVRAIAEAAGHVVENRAGTYFVLKREEAGKDAVTSNTRIRTFKVQYTNPEVASKLLEKHLSRFGKITTLPGRRLLVIEDQPEFLDRLDSMLSQIDVRPLQIMIEAKILEIALNADQTYGIDWKAPFQFEDGAGNLGTRGLAPTTLGGLFFDVVTPNFEILLNALRTRGRVRTLSTPKLLVLENQEAEVIIGDRQGFKVTTTINQVTTESIEFLESGVILRVRASIDRSGKVMLEIHPEVSNGTVVNGIPSQTTTEVTTQMLADDGEKIFIGGLIRNIDTETRQGIPILGDIPVIGALFSQTAEKSNNTETVVLITPYIVRDDGHPGFSAAATRKIDRAQGGLTLKSEWIMKTLPSATSPYPAFTQLPESPVEPEPGIGPSAAEMN